MIIYKIKNRLKEEGVMHTFISAFWFALRQMGVEFHRYNYLVNDINYERQKDFWEQHKIEDIKQLTYEDFMLGDKTIITEQKLQIIKRWLDKRTYFPFGIIRHGKLIYYCWLSLDELEFSKKIIKGKLGANECLFLDSYCAPDYRRKGINVAASAYRLIKGYEKGRTRAVVFILQENTPSLKSQLKVGYKIEFKFYVLKIWGREWTNYFSLKEKQILYEKQDNRIW